jgi:hypothetical protein
VSKNLSSESKSVNTSQEIELSDIELAALKPSEEGHGPAIGRTPTSESVGEWHTIVQLQRSVSIEQRKKKFEEHNFYIRKQLQDSPLAQRLIKFAEENSILINAVLRQNIKLLKSSLLPMLLVRIVSKFTPKLIRLYPNLTPFVP